MRRKDVYSTPSTMFQYTSGIVFAIGYWVAFFSPQDALESYTCLYNCFNPVMFFFFFLNSLKYLGHVGCGGPLC